LLGVEVERDELIEKAKAKVKEAYTQKDRQLIQCVNAISELNKTVNLLFERLQEWYGIYFPELRISEQDNYCKLVIAIDRKNIDKGKISSIVGEEKANGIFERAKRSIGVDLEEKDLGEIRKLATEILNLYSLREALENYQNSIAKELCPNITHLVEPALAAKLIAQAGRLERLAIMPASTIQVLGAEKALFKHLRNHTKPPKHGIIFQHPYISTSPKKIRGKIARILSTKLAIALKADFYSKHFIAEKLKEDFEKRVKEIREHQK
jgi:nucleolar protein 56